MRAFCIQSRPLPTAGMTRLPSASTLGSESPGIRKPFGGGHLALSMSAGPADAIPPRGNALRVERKACRGKRPAKAGFGGCRDPAAFGGASPTSRPSARMRVWAERRSPPYRRLRDLRGPPPEPDVPSAPLPCFASKSCLIAVPDLQWGETFHGATVHGERDCFLADIAAWSREPAGDMRHSCGG